MQLIITKGTTSKIIPIFLSDSSKTDGSGLDGLVFNSAGLVAKYKREGDSEWTTMALVTATEGTWTSLGFKEDAEGLGYYEIGIPNAALAVGAGVEWVRINLYGATNMAPLPILIQLIDASIFYEGGVWVDSGASNTNTQPGVDGIRRNPVSTLVAARTLANAIGMQKYYIINSSSLTLAATHENWEFEGLGRASSILNLGSQDVDNSSFKNLSVTGTQGGSNLIQMDGCLLTALSALKIWANRCCLSGNITIAAGTMFIFDQCLSAVAGASTPEMTFSAGVTAVQFRHYSGGLEVKGMTSDHTMSYETDGQLVVNANCTSGVIVARGNMSITDNGTTMDITQDAVYNIDNIWDEILTGATHNVNNSAGRILRQLKGAIIEDGTAQAGGPNTITLANGASAVNDFYNHAVIIITAGTGQGLFGLIEDYVGSTRIATMHENWVIQPDDTSEYAIIAYGKVHALELDSLEATAITQVTNAVWVSAVTLAEQAAGAPPATPTPQQAVMYPYMHLRNKGVSDSNAGKFKIYNDAGNVVAEGTLDDTAGVFTKGKLGAPT